METATNIYLDNSNEIEIIGTMNIKNDNHEKKNNTIVPFVFYHIS